MLGRVLLRINKRASSSHFTVLRKLKDHRKEDQVLVLPFVRTLSSSMTAVSGVTHALGRVVHLWLNSRYCLVTVDLTRQVNRNRTLASYGSVSQTHLS